MAVPSLDHACAADWAAGVYEPAEDTYLMLDVLAEVRVRAVPSKLHSAIDDPRGQKFVLHA